MLYERSVRKDSIRTNPSVLIHRRLSRLAFSNPYPIRPGPRAYGGAVFLVRHEEQDKETEFDQFDGFGLINERLPC